MDDKIIMLGNLRHFKEDLAAVAVSGLYNDLQNLPTLGTAAAKDSTNSVIENSTALVESGAVKSAIDSALTSAYKAGGSKTCSELTSALLVAANEGYVYTITDTGTTTSDFIEGAGVEIGTGSDVGVIKRNGAYKFNLLPGIIDTSNFVQKSATGGLLKNDGSVDTTHYISDVSSKADKVTNATSGNFAGLDANGNLADSGKKASDFVEAVQGKGLSTEDYTAAEKTKLAGLSNYDDTALSGRVTAIETVVPSAATEQNKLSTAADVAGENISGSATGTSIVVTDSAGGMVQGLTIYGQSEVVDGEIKSVGDDGLTVTTANSDNTVTTSAEFTTALPLRGVSDTVRDVMQWDGSAGEGTNVCNVLNMGELTWNKSDNGRMYSSSITKIKRPADRNTLPNIVNPIYMPDTDYNVGNLITDKTIAIGNDFRIYVYDTDYTDATAFKTAMSGVMLVYELATPTTTPLTTAEISALASLKTYDHITHIDATDEPEMAVDYLRNTDNGKAVARLEEKIKSGFDEIKKESKHFVYAFYVDQNDSNPATCVHPYYNTKYGCDNLFYQNAYMDYTADKFNYGSWENFIKEYFKPCMLSYDGHVDYYLDPDDYEKNLDGGASDIKDMSYNGNVMVQVKTLWFKRWTTGGKYYCILSDRKLDKSFKAYAHHDINGNICEYIYRAAYDGSYDGTRLRSISGIDYHNASTLTVNKIMSNTTRQQEINFAKANNTANEQGEGWNILHKAELDLFNDVLLLIGMDTNTQATFGNGNIDSYVSESNTGIIATGTMDKKGLFYGKSDNISGVKVLGIEMPWGNNWKSCLGWILSSNQHLVKMTHGTEDGSVATDYNLDGTGYVATGKTITANGYISAFDGADTGFLPTAASGSATTYMCDYVWQSTATTFALVGGRSAYGALCGAFCASLDNSAAAAGWYIGATLSYKPLAA